MKKTLVLASVVLAAALAGCGATEEPPKDDAKEPDTTTETTETGGSDSVDLTEAFTYDDGLSLQLSDFSRGTSTEFGIPADTEYVKFTLTADNGTDADIDLTLLFIECKVGESGAAAEEVYDEGLGDGMSGSATAGGKLSAVYACAVPADEKKLQVEVTTNDGEDLEIVHDTAIFVGEVKE